MGNSGSGGALTDADTINLAIAQKTLAYSTTTFPEAAANDGSITTSSTITLIHDTFTGNDGDDWSAPVSDVPAGLTASLIRNDATHATLSFTGQATAHANANDINNLSVDFDDGKFTGGSAAGIAGATTDNLLVDFVDPPPNHAPTIAQPFLFSRTDYYAGGYVYGVTSTDVNGDGTADLVWATSASNTISVLTNNGDGSFSDRVNFATGLGPNALTSADVNGDGKADLIVTNVQSNTVSTPIYSI